MIIFAAIQVANLCQAQRRHWTQHRHKRSESSWSAFVAHHFVPAISYIRFHPPPAPAKSTAAATDAFPRGLQVPVANLAQWFFLTHCEPLVDEEITVTHTTERRIQANFVHVVAKVRMVRYFAWQPSGDAADSVSHLRIMIETGACLNSSQHARFQSKQVKWKHPSLFLTQRARVHHKHTLAFWHSCFDPAPLNMIQGGSHSTGTSGAFNGLLPVSLCPPSLCGGHFKRCMNKY